MTDVIRGRNRYPVTLSDLDIAFLEAERLEDDAILSVARVRRLIEDELDADVEAEKLALWLLPSIEQSAANRNVPVLNALKSIRRLLLELNNLRSDRGVELIGA